jgi:hypothetical protein
LLVGAGATSAQALTTKVTPRTTLYVSTKGSDAASCTRQSPCASFARAYAVAPPGSTVLVSSGSYAHQTVAPRPGFHGPRIVFTAAPRASVTVPDEFVIQGSNVEFRNMTLSDLELPQDAHDVTIRNVVNHGVWMEGAANISVIGGEVSCGVCAFHSHIDAGSDGRAPRNILFDGVHFHDWYSAEDGQHTECLQIGAGDGITIRNSIFRNCGTRNGGATADLHISWFGVGPVTKNVLVENNFFFPSGNTYAIQMDDYANVDLRYNSIAGPVIIFDRSGPGTSIDFVANIMRYSGCSAESSGIAINWRYNVQDGGTCGPTDRNAPSGFVDPKSNLHLRPGAPAIGHGDPRLYPRRDIDGDRRPRARTPDAGADERR